MAYLTPPLWAKGRYTVNSPFTVSPSTIYQCIALRNFDDIVKENEDVYARYYKPFGIDENTYRAHDRNNAIIVTLVDEFGVALYIPSPYIASFPNMGDVPYKRMIMSVDLGPLPDYVDLTYLDDMVSNMVTETVGVADPKINVHVAPAKNAVSSEQHDTLEAARTAAITNNQTYKALYLAEKERTAALEERVQILTDALIAAQGD